MNSKASEFATRIVTILLDVLPDNADSITLDAEADAGYASAELTLNSADGSTFYLPDDDTYPDDAVSAINEEIMDLWDAMTAEGQDPWYTAKITAHRDGRFDVDFSYEPPEG